jgi:uncharacterized protein
MAVPQVTAVDLILTYDCNCRCPYCFIRDRGDSLSMSPEMLDRALDWVAENSGESVELILLGGEPTLMPHLIERAVYRALRWQRASGKRFSFNMTTNALNIDEPLARNLATWGIRYLLSIDGTGERHNQSRPALNMTDPFAHLEEKFSMLKAYQPHMAGRLTIVPANVEWLDTDLNKLFQMGFESFIISPATGMTWTEEKLDTFTAQLTAFAARRVPDRDGRLQPRIEPIDGEDSGCGTWGCSAGRGRVAIDPKGMIFGCARMTRLDAEDGLYLGSLDTGIISDGNILRFQDDTYSSRPAECISCDLRERCIGGCPSVNYDATGSLVTPAPDECRVARAFDRIKRESLQRVQSLRAS